MKYRKSFYEHGCTEEIAEYVLMFDLWYSLHASERHHEQVMYVGWDQQGKKLWEIAIELYPNGREDWAFHAKSATVRSIKEVGL
jgi:hypothetical protein